MTLEEIRQKRTFMEKTIFEAIKGFEDATGLTVEDVELVRAFGALGNMRESIRAVDTTIRL